MIIEVNIKKGIFITSKDKNEVSFCEGVLFYDDHIFGRMQDGTITLGFYPETKEERMREIILEIKEAIKRGEDFYEMPQK